jgi:hypothetical protein
VRERERERERETERSQVLRTFKTFGLSKLTVLGILLLKIVTLMNTSTVEFMHLITYILKPLKAGGWHQCSSPYFPYPADLGYNTISLDLTILDSNYG